MSRLAVATVQWLLQPEPTLPGLLAHVERVVDDAARRGAELVVLPELATSGLIASRADAATLALEELPAAYHELYPSFTEGWVAGVAELAARKGLWLLAGSHFRRDDAGAFRNTAYLAHPDGRVEAQDKLHPTPPELGLGVHGGEDVVVTHVGPTRAAILVCADVEFPEVSRTLALMGVELILCPSLTWNRRGAQRVAYGAHARAMENQLFVAVSVGVGTTGLPRAAALHGTGRAFVACPIDATFRRNDGVLAATEGDGEVVVVAELDFERLAESRAHAEPPGLVHRRPDLYRRLEAGRAGAAPAPAAPPPIAPNQPRRRSR